MSYAGVWIRFVALVADGIVFFVVGLFVGLAGGITTGNGTDRFAGVSLLFWIVIGLLYTVVMETTSGGTVGKHLAGLRVVDEYGRRISVSQALIRYLLRFVDALIFGLIGAAFIWSSPTRQRLGDRAASTFVVRAASLGRATTPQGPPASLPTLPAATRTTHAASSTIWEEFRN